MINLYKAPLTYLVLIILFCSCSKRVYHLSSSTEIILIPSQHINTQVRTRPGETPFEFRTFLYKFRQDTFRLTVIDHNRNGKFNDPEDIFVVSSTDTSVPLFPFLNPNVTKYAPDMLVAYKEHVLKIKHIEEKGKSIKLKYIGDKSNVLVKPVAIYSQDMDADLIIEDVNTGEEKRIASIFKDNPQKLVYFHFWWTACAPCFDEIPYLNKLEQEGVLVINLANKERETHDHLIKTITKHSYPGLHYYGTPDVVREFSQNGFPFGTLVDAQSGKKLIEGKELMLVYEAIKK